VAKFTIITPVFNGEKYIEETVISVLMATDGLDYEYFVIDDGSTDNTRKILEKYFSKLKYFYQENSGQATAINLAINKANSTYSTIVNSDDPLLSKGLFQEAERIMDLEPKVVATYPDWNMISSEGKILETVRVAEFDLVELVGKFNCLIGPGGIFRTDIAKKVNGWDPSYRYVPDYNFWLRLSDFGIFKHVPYVQATWRTHESSISVSSRSKAMADERIKVINNYLDCNPQTPKTLRNMAVAYSHYRAAVLSFFDPQIDGRRLLFKSIYAYPKILIQKNVVATLYLLLLPISRFVLNFLMRFSYFRDLSDLVRRGIK
jgi:glycosyltransferase involved in cell wall biosynthesis